MSFWIHYLITLFLSYVVTQRKEYSPSTAPQCQLLFPSIRTIIGVVEESVELVRHTQHQQRLPTTHKALYERLEPSLRHKADHKGTIASNNVNLQFASLTPQENCLKRIKNMPPDVHLEWLLFYCIVNNSK